MSDKDYKKKYKRCKKEYEELEELIEKYEKAHRGKRGPKGDTAPPGRQGKPGPAGRHGGPRVRGPRGEMGPPGPQGLQGEMGPPGPQGEMGPMGPAGPAAEISEILITPTSQRYFYIVSSDIHTPQDILANLFTDDNGDAINGFPLLGQNSYTRLYINGILQPGSLYSVSSSALSINAEGETIYSGTPITLEYVSYVAQIII